MLIGANLLFTEKKGGLPYDAEVEYLQGDGQAYILDDRIVLNGAATVRLDVALTDLSYNQDLLGYYVSAKKASGFRFGSSGLVVRYSAYNRVSLAIDAGSRYTIIGSNSESSILDEDGTILATGSAVTSWTTPLTVFCATSSSASPYARYTATSPSTARVYKIEIESENVNADLIPVRKGSVGYMYDKLTGKLYGNAGTGAFVIGPDKGLPYDAEVEYLQGDGVAYIELDDRYAEYIKRAGISKGTSNTAEYFSGSFSGRHIHAFGSNADSVIICESYRTTYEASYVADGFAIYDLVADGTNFVISKDGVELASTPCTTKVPLAYSGHNLALFASKYYYTSGAITSIFTGRCSYFKVEDDNSLILDLIPVRKGSVGYMYDKVSGQLFGNSASSGAFIVGPDK